MCRWVAYAGPEIYLEDILFHQDNSIISQSLSAKESAWITNGDGFGVAWYTDRRTSAGLFKDVLPAWNDSNLRSLAGHIRTKMFFAHVRATTGTAVNRSNCHPFIWRNWTFMHNGQIGSWSACRKDFESLIGQEHFHLREGTTDSEALFLLALSQGLEDDPIKAVSRAIQSAMEIMEQHKASEPFRASIALSNGESIWAFRYSSDQSSPSLYFGSPRTRADSVTVGNPINTIASEPLDHSKDHWTKVPESSGIHWSTSGVEHFSILP